MDECTIVVDTNHHENALVLLLEERGLEVHRTALKTGDVALVYGKITILVERKSVSDLAGGIAHPSRFIHSQRQRLAGEMADNPNTFALVLVHGVRPTCDDVRMGYGPLTGKTWHSVVQTTQLAPYNIPIIHSVSLDGVADQIVLLRRNLVAGKFDRGVNADADAAPPPCLNRKRRADTPSDLLVGMLAALPGCSEAKGRALVAEFPSLGAIAAASEKEIASVKVGERKLGPVFAKRIRSVCG